LMHLQIPQQDSTFPLSAYRTGQVQEQSHGTAFLNLREIVPLLPLPRHPRAICLPLGTTEASGLKLEETLTLH